MAPYTSAGASLAVKLGDTVTAGQIVARLDDRQLRQELDAGRAQLRTAQAAVVQAEVDRRGAEIVLTREKAAEAAGVGSRADLATATQAVAKAGAAVTVARATAEERATRLAQLQAHLSEMTLVSPIAGSVALIYAQDGARVEEGRPVLRVISGGVLVQFAIPADKAGSVRPGDLVDLRLDRRPDLLTARVGHIAPELDAVAQMVIADADLVDPPPDLQPGTVGRILPRPARPAAPRPTK
jgi:multidrug efflux pump subunit AcrA (membrane-fusion protein)